MPQFEADRDEVLARAREAGVTRVLLVGGIDEESGLGRALELGRRYGCPVSGGVHPHEARLASEATYEELRALGRDGAIVAVGEVGLDFYYDNSPRDAQREAFRRQIRLARELELPLIVHTRDADDETAEILEQEAAGEVTGVVHCFTGGEDLARRALALGFLISFSGIVSFPRSEVIQQVARDVPSDRMLVETDAPFLAPAPHRGKRNEPAFVVEVARRVAELRGESLDAVARTTTQNFERLFRL
jgi:TatD DNase family protein